MGCRGKPNSEPLGCTDRGVLVLAAGERADAGGNRLGDAVQLERDLASMTRGLRDMALRAQLMASARGVSRSSALNYLRSDGTVRPQFVFRLGDLPTSKPLRAWLAVRGTAPVPELVLNARGDALTRSGFEYILDKHVQRAAHRCPNLLTKSVSPHCLRHTCALTILQATKDIRRVSLWLGHAHLQTTEIYTRVDPSVKLETLESVIAPKLRTGRFKATDKLLTALKTRTAMRATNLSK